MPTILVVDDDASVARAIKRVLRALYDVEIANDGQQAHERIVAGPKVDLVITDWDMPRMTGPQLIATLARTGDTTPVILMSGDFDKSGRSEPTGETARIPKPFENDVLRALVRKTIGPGVIITPAPDLTNPPR